MKDQTRSTCPGIEDLSALTDGELPGRAGEAVRAHATQCPLCAATLRDFAAVRSGLRPLQATRCDVDLAALVAPRLRRRRTPRGWSWGSLWQLVPGGMGAAAALAVGAYLGLLLVAGGGTAMRPAAMTVFDGAPPGALCAGLPACSPRGR